MASKAAIRERAGKAIKEMKGCGFPSAKTKVVLKSLLKSFDNSWEMIEKDNYSVLVDALISHEEDQGFIQKTTDAVDDDDLEKKEECVSDETAFCRKRVWSQEDQECSPSVHGQGTSEQIVQKKPKSEKHNSTGSTSPQALIRHYDAEPVSQQGSYKGKGVADTPVSPRTHQWEKRTGSQNLICFKEPKLEPGIDLLSKENVDAGPCDGDFPTFEVPISIIPPPTSSCRAEGHMGTIRNCSSVVDHLTSMDNNSGHSRSSNGSSDKSKENHPEPSNKNDSSVVPLESSSKHIEVASSSKGEVKLSLSFNDTSSDISLLSLEAIMRKVEDKCLKSYKIIQPNFSLMNLMREMCQTVLELSESPEEERLINMSPMLDSLKHSGVPNAFSGASTSKGILNSDSLCLVSVPQHEPALGHIRPLHDASDISKGEERVRITLVNEINSEQYPASFLYIPQNIVYQNGHVDFSLARIGDEDCCSDCFGDCLSASIPCACARETGGEYAYTSDGLIKKDFLDDCLSRFHNPQKQHFVYCKDCPLERIKNDTAPDPCKGHLLRKFIKECWVKCGCNKQCGNRVVQRGVMCNLQVFYTAEGKGWGLRTLDELPRGTFVCEYVGEVLTNTELYERTMKMTGNARHTYPVLLDADWGSEGVLKDEEALCLDATFYGNVARFINHRCYDSNLVEIPVEVETPDRHYYHLAFFTNRKVEPFEELTWDYGIDFNDHGHPVKAFRCRCGSRYCRNMKKSSSGIPTATSPDNLCTPSDVHWR